LPFEADAGMVTGISIDLNKLKLYCENKTIGISIKSLETLENGVRLK